MSKKKNKRDQPRRQRPNEGTSYGNKTRNKLLGMTKEQIKKQPKWRKNENGDIEWLCRDCREHFLPELMVTCSRNKRGFLLKCKKCWTEYHRKYRRKNRTLVREIVQKSTQKWRKSLKKVENGE